MQLALLAAISASSLGWLVVEIIIAGLIFWLCTWGLAQVGLPEPFAKIAKVVLVIAVVVFLVNALMALGGHPFIAF